MVVSFFRNPPVVIPGSLRRIGEAPPRQARALLALRGGRGPESMNTGLWNVDCGRPAARRPRNDNAPSAMRGIWSIGLECEHIKNIYPVLTPGPAVGTLADAGK